MGKPKFNWTDKGGTQHRVVILSVLSNGEVLVGPHPNPWSLSKQWTARVQREELTEAA